MVKGRDVYFGISECPAEVVFATRLEKTQQSFSLFAKPGGTQVGMTCCT